MEKVPQLHMFNSPNRRSLGKQGKYAMQNSFYSNEFSKQSTRFGDQKLHTEFKCTQNYYNQALKLLGSTSRNKLTSYADSHETKMRDNNEINLQKFRKRNQFPQKIIKANPQVISHQRPVLIQQEHVPNMHLIYRGPSPPQQVFIRPQTPPPRGPIIVQNGPFFVNPNATQHMHPPMFVTTSPMSHGSPLLHSTSVQQMPSYEQMIKTVPSLMYPPSRQNDQDHIIEIDRDSKPQLNRNFTFRQETNNKQNKPLPNKKNPFSFDAVYLLEVQDCERRLPQLSRIYDSSKQAEQSSQKETLMEQLMQMREQNLKATEKCLGDLDRILQRFGSEQDRESKRQQFELTRTRKSLFTKVK